MPDPEDSEDEREIVIPLSTNDLCMETVKENFVIAFADGTCTHQSFPCLRRAGFGVAFDKDLKHSRTVSQPLSGSEQSAQRAEVRAILAALQIENRPLHIFSDSSYAPDAKSTEWHVAPGGRRTHRFVEKNPNTFVFDTTH